MTDSAEGKKTPDPTSIHAHLTLPSQSLGLPTGQASGQMTLPGMPDRVMISADFRSGPLPPASEFRSYHETYEPAAKWILDEATKNSEHVRSMEKVAIKAEQLDLKLARLLPFCVVVVFMLIFAVVCFANIWVGAAGLATTFASVVLAYLKQFETTSTSDGVVHSGPQQIPTTAPPRPREQEPRGKLS